MRLLPLPGGSGGIVDTEQIKLIGTQQGTLMERRCERISSTGQIKTMGQTHPVECTI